MRRVAYLAMGLAPLLVGEASPSPQASQPCAVTLSPAGEYAQVFEMMRGMPEAWTNICLAPGTYAHPIRIHHAQFVRVLAPEGGVTISAAVMPLQAATGAHSTFEIHASHHVVVRGLDILNSYTFDVDKLLASNGYSAVSRAVAVTDADNIVFENARITSSGKQTVHVNRVAQLSFRDTDISGYYFLVDLNWSHAVHFYRTKFQQNASRTLPWDEHSMLWTYHSDAVFEDSTFNRVTGRSLLSGIQSSEHRILVVGNTRGNLDSWVQVHPNYRHIKVHIAGSYPQSDAFWQNTFNGGGPSHGSAVCQIIGAAPKCQWSRAIHAQ